MKISIQPKINKDTLKVTSALVLNVFLNESGKADFSNGTSLGYLDKPTQEAVRSFLVVNSYKVGDTKILFIPSGVTKNIILYFSDAKKWNTRILRVVARKIIRTAKQNKFSTIALFLKDFLVEGIEPQEISKILSENMILAHFDFSEFYKEKPKEGWPEVKTLILFIESPIGPKEYYKTIERGVKAGVILGEETNYSRVLANSPAGTMTPKTLAEAAKSAGKRAGFSVTIFDEKKIKSLGMGGILGVGQGSSARPYFIIMEYKGGQKSEKPLAFVGKGVTFDSGGVNIKSTDGLTDMHLDMSGGAGVIHAVAAIARLKLPINVCGFVPAVENMVSGASYRPGDILKTYSGKTIEVLNTDAEGRIILADAISYCKTKKPALIFDVATLTGAAVVALGQRASATFTKDDNLSQFLSQVGEKSGDYVWPLPMWDEYEEDIKGSFGDVSNTGKTRYGGATNGAMFLWQFAKPNLWAHLDIAPTMTSIESDCLAKGATGTGVRLMVELARTWHEFKQS